MNDNFVGPERSLMVAATLMKRLRDERRLFASELRALDRETQTQHVLQRKDFLSKKVPEMEQEMYELQKALQKLLASPTDQLNPSGKYYVMAEKLVKV
mmetsp:Transcript_455/g.1066  ORF Transcript_455/g.1066 Transcript_455/m.1066 type:complete len:98 (+) Transcript_455:147-440(+)|eukprot:CAMPEP_0116126402 /NCGR_PEP_ID=MMETSP0329-20121206/6314_1 /TAXON_ID=697910 /ORGANISM="Pseudo-nitzschia arenysensis, Strain B593" /LENGTH=97 /DNA_ID=CAMNT_0003620485 /DNA_START=136 /DNA_END=429 /DNA_ORIENTATION=+